MSTPTTEQLLGGGGRVVKFEAPGDAVEGTVVLKDVNQQTDFKTGEKLFYPRSGDPMWQIIATLQTTIREDADDDGMRRVYFKSGLMKALRDTLRDQKLKDIEPGGWIRIIHTGLGVAEGGGNAPKLYIVEYRSQSAQVISGQQAVANVQAGLGGQPVTGADPRVQQAFQQHGSGYAQQQPAPQPVQQYVPQPAPVQQAPVQQAPAPAPQGPSQEVIAALIAAGIDPNTLYPGSVQ